MYGTLPNSSVMIGEQKHKIFKAHAPRTNQKENELQLFKSINLSQAIRHISEDSYCHDPKHSHISQQILQLLESCLGLRQKFIGIYSMFQLDDPIQQETYISANIDFTGSVFHKIYASKPVDTKRLLPEIKADI